MKVLASFVTLIIIIAIIMLIIANVTFIMLIDSLDLSTFLAMSALIILSDSLVYFAIKSARKR
jgi:hypothetical protein